MSATEKTGSLTAGFDKERAAHKMDGVKNIFIGRFARACQKAELWVALFYLSMGAAFAAEPLPKVDLKVAYPGVTFDRPLWLEEAPDSSKRIFVVEQDGRIWILPRERAGKDKKLFFDITDRKPHQDNEEGLLGLAFHPQFKTNHKFYVFYSQQDPKRNVLSEFQVGDNADQANLASERVLMEIPKPYWNHDGGCIVFGPDGYLYITVGDGGDGGDPHNVGQSLNFFQAKILRIDVNTREGHWQYGIPKDNPFIGPQHSEEGHHPEIWAYGLRNVWRMSFDRATGELWAADVGQEKFEEVDIIKKGGNYGWSVREGFHPFKQTQRGPSTPIDPIIEYAHTPAIAKESKFPDHGLGVSITGGYVYRGKKIPQLRGVYVYGDFQYGTVWGLRYENGELTADEELVKSNPARNIASFGEDANGEIYAVAFDGKIYEVVAASDAVGSK